MNADREHTSMTNLSRAYVAAAAYYIVLVVATVSHFRMGHEPIDTGAVLMALLPVQIVLLLLCLVVARSVGWLQVGFGPLRLTGAMWLLPSIVVMLLMCGALLPHLSGITVPRRTIILVIAVPLLIGITEEIMFRGIVLRAAMARMPLFYAMLVSAALFSLMHGIVGISGQSILTTLQQVAFAFLVGVFLAPIAIATGTLWIVIIWHAVWDMLVYTSQLAGIIHHFALIGIMIQTLVSILLWARLVRSQT
jgi:membrane protease YdiL (CAAX protease family)